MECSKNFSLNFIKNILTALRYRIGTIYVLCNQINFSLCSLERIFILYPAKLFKSCYHCNCLYMWIRMCSIVQKNWMQKLIWLSFVSRIYIYQNGLFILNDFVIHTYYKFRPTNRKKNIFRHWGSCFGKRSLCWICLKTLDLSTCPALFLGQRSDIVAGFEASSHKHNSNKNDLLLFNHMGWFTSQCFSQEQQYCCF